MCGRFTLKSPGRTKFDGLIRSHFPPLFPRYNIAPSQAVVTIVQHDDVRSAALLQWGLIPSWSKEAKGIINARAETLEEKPSFSESFQRRRCLIPADGFYEWKKSGKWKQPYYFQLKDAGPFAFAGIWDEWYRGDLSINSCAIITTTANDLLAPIHDRMPVILHAKSYEAWLSGDTTLLRLKELLLPYPASEMTSHPVGSDVNKPEVDRPNLVERVDESAGENLSLF
jgi:putative SOS response-associated peptidase YedK